jgi:Phage integrase family
MAASSNRNANRMFHDLCKKADVPQLRVHDLRHSCATLLFTMGVQPATVQRILRHSSITVTTCTYVEVIEAVQRDALDRWAACSVPSSTRARPHSGLSSIGQLEASECHLPGGDNRKRLEPRSPLQKVG